jgi:hypothetical protein
MIGVVKGDQTTKGGPAVAMSGATDAVVLVTNLTGTETGNENETGTENTAIATTSDTAIAIGTETTRETVVDAGVKKMVTTQTHQKIAWKGNVARTVQTSHLFLFLGTAHAGALRGLIPGIIIVIDVLGILAIPETNSTTRPGTGGIVGVAATNAAPAMMMILLNANRPRPRRWRTPSVLSSKFSMLR